ncbi:diguanylate cyclase [Variovorax sp. J22P168]|uniref:GGDEF domain-containing response regulator n=1 Tax=Variovorax jilinensis TaxID=3053513 RepID=UPI002576F0DC|nr:diguanylate cyclase [Variovorax sp. J22P168]MDM0013466.1 diguanylate cyclase [Variovorax sp. J22P168]
MPSAPDAEAQDAVTVLLVDDQPVIAMMVRKMLAVDPAIAMHVCSEADAAVAQACAVRPTVILQDLVMPGANGLELVTAYREHPDTRDIPIIVLSSNDEPEMKKSAFAMGANDYLVKLPEPIELIARIRYHSRAYTTLVERDNAYRALRLSEQQLLASNLELQRLTNSDGLTGLPNRRSFNDCMAREWDRSRTEGTPLSLLMIDVDYFKSYNDNFGHLAGDDALRCVAEAIRDAHADPTCLAARFGGEEFAVVLPGLEAARAAEVAEQIRLSVEATTLPHPAPEARQVTVSIGVATRVATSRASPDLLIAAADARLYQAKCEGRNRIVAA